MVTAQSLVVEEEEEALAVVVAETSNYIESLPSLHCSQLIHGTAMQLSWSEPVLSGL